MNNKDGRLQLYLKLDQVKDGKVIDTSANGIHGSIHGNPELVDDDLFGKCLSFDGESDYIRLPDIDFDYSEGLTIVAWVFYKEFRNWSRIIDFGNGRNDNNIVFANYEETNNLDFGVYVNEKAASVRADGKLVKDQWLNLAATIDTSGDTKLYCNGQELMIDSEHDEIRIPENIKRTKNYIGKSNWTEDHLFEGRMAHLQVYKRVLSQTEILQSMALSIVCEVECVNSSDYANWQVIADLFGLSVKQEYSKAIPKESSAAE